MQKLAKGEVGRCGNPSVDPTAASGVEDKTVVRSLLDLAAWYESLQDPNLELFRNTRKGWEDIYLEKKSRGQGSTDYRINIDRPNALLTLSETGSVTG
jgi:hypothetical protein